MKKEKRSPGKTTGPGEHIWVKEFSGTVTVCDKDGVIVGLNDASAKQFAEKGGRKLIGSCIFDCHPEPAKSKFKELMKNRRPNIYTIQKDGRRKLVFQAPWYQEGEFAGYLDMTVEIPWKMPHYNRDQK
jgi:hypothetical protein